MKFEIRERYRHKRCKDVDIVVRKILGETDTGVSCLVDWVNQRSDFVHYKLDRIFINAESYKHWKKIDSNKH